MDKKRVEALFADEAFVKSFLALETPEEVQVAAKAKGVDLTLDEINAIKKSLAKFTSEELSDDSLEKVAGGSNYTPEDLLQIQMQFQSMFVESIKSISDIQWSIIGTLRNLAPKV